MERPAVKRGHGSGLRPCPGLAVRCRGLLFRPIERTHSEKGVMGEGMTWPENSRDIEKDGERGKTLSVVGIRKSRVGCLLTSAAGQSMRQVAYYRST